MTRRRLSVVLLWLGVLAACIGYGLTRLALRTDLRPFLANTADADSALAYLSQSPAQRFILIGVTGGTVSARAQTSQTLAQALSKSPFFEQVINGPAALTEATLDQLFTYRYLLSPKVNAERFTVESLRHALNEHLTMLRSTLVLPDRRYLASDPTGELRAILTAYQGRQGPAIHQGVWVSQDGTRALLIAQTKADAFDLAAQEQVLDTIQHAFSTLAAPGVTLELSGASVFALDAQATIRAEASLLSAVASIFTALLLWAAFRAWRALWLTALPLVTGILVASVLTDWVYGGLFGITAAFGITLLGAANDYPIHLLSHLDGQHPARVVLRGLWPTLRLSVASTLLGYGAMLTTGFAGLNQLGFFSVVGLATAALHTRFVLPALLPPYFKPPGTDIQRLARLEALFKRPRWTGWLISIMAILTAGIGAFTADAWWEDDLSRLSPITPQALATDQTLRRELGAAEAGHAVLLSGNSAEVILQQSEDLAHTLSQAMAQGLIRGFEAPSQVLPSLRTQAQRQAVLPRPAELAAYLAQAQQGLLFKPEAFAPFVQDIAQARHMPLLDPTTLGDTPLGARLETLLFAGSAGWVGLIPLHDVHDPLAFARWFAQQDTAARYVNLKAETEQQVHHFRDTALMHAGLGALGISLILALGLRDMRRLVAVLMPVALALGLTFALLVGLGERLSIFHVVAALLVLGLGIDYGLFFSRTPVPWSTLHAVATCAATTIAVFGVLAFSAIPVLRSIGLTVTLGVTASFALALMLTRTVMTQPHPASSSTIAAD